MGHHFAGCADYKIGTHRQGFLFLHKSVAIATTIYGNGTGTGEIGNTFQVLFDLDRQFAGGYNHQCIDGMRRMRFGNDALNQGQQKGGGFARTGLGRGNDVFSVEDVGYNLFLNRCGRFVTGAFDAFQQALVEWKIGESHREQILVKIAISGYRVMPILLKISAMVSVGEYNDLLVSRLVEIGAYLDDGKDGILLPNRFLPRGTQAGDRLKVFVYHDSENRLIATTQEPLGVLGDIVKLRVVSVTPQGAFMDMGLMKDLFIPKSLQRNRMIPNGEYVVKIVLDEQTGRMVASQKFESELSNDELTVAVNEAVDLLVYRRTDIGYVVIINKKHTGVLHFTDIYQLITEGDRLKGFVKQIYPDNKIDVALGTRGYERVDGESQRILQLLEKSGGFLPYHDKTDPDTIYEIFGMSKKTFKMSIGKLFKQRIIELKDNGIQLATHGTHQG